MTIEYHTLRPEPGAAYWEIPFSGAADSASRTVDRRPRAVLSTVLAGDMTPGSGDENRFRLFAELSIAPERVHWVRQIHSRRVVTVKSNSIAGAEADGMIAADKDVVLAVTVADCLPVFLWEQEDGKYALVHSGWKGTGIAGVAAAEMRSGETSGRGVHAAIGPGIGPCCYNVAADRAAEFEKWCARAVSRRNSVTYLDLREANLAVLEQFGIQSTAVADNCTACSPALGSFRRQGPDLFMRMVALFGHF